MSLVKISTRSISEMIQGLKWSNSKERIVSIRPCIWVLVDSACYHIILLSLGRQSIEKMGHSLALPRCVPWASPAIDHKAP